MKLKGSSYCYIGVMGIAAAVIILALPMESLKPKLLPLILGGIVFVLSAAGLWRDLFVQNNKPDGETKKDVDSEVADARLGGYLAIGVWIAGFFLAIYLVGFTIATLLFVLAYIKAHGAKWLTAIIFTIITLAVVYGVFEVVLKMSLYKGLFFAF
ncbi:MAG: tripartite tricarboxylate transporter TctB family protein [Chloroflexi bacterium]|nr:tripartite tricarboxylate transporter TctB family protein [Chloroflexota bacterium]